jgi:hypothetical protein
MEMFLTEKTDKAKRNIKKELLLLTGIFSKNVLSVPQPLTWNNRVQLN